jgi:hypothetical protein
MHAVTVLALSILTLALVACDLPDPPPQQRNATSWQDAPLGSRIRSASVTSSAVVSQTDPNVLQKFQSSEIGISGLSH